MAHGKTYRQMARYGGGLGCFVVARTRHGHAHEYWIGGAITRHRQVWGFNVRHAFRFKTKEHAKNTLLRLRERDGRVDDVRHFVTEEQADAKP